MDSYAVVLLSGELSQVIKKIESQQDSIKESLEYVSKRQEDLKFYIARQIEIQEALKILRGEV